MSNIGNPFGGGDLALQSGRALQCPHDPASLLGIARLPTAKTVKLFMTTSRLLCCAVHEIFVRRVAGSLEEAPQNLNPINWRIRAKKKIAPDSAIRAKARTAGRAESESKP